MYGFFLANVTFSGNLVFLNGKKDFFLYFQNIADFSFNLAFDVDSIIFVTIANYVLCYYINTLRINSVSVGDIIYDLHWYQLPSKG